VIVVTKDGLKRIEWASGRQVWAEVPAHPDFAAAPFGGFGATGNWPSIFLPHSYHLGDNDPRPAQARLVQPAPDLDGDGEPDLIFSSRWVPGLMAVSGKTGKVLWYHTTAVPLFADKRAAGWKVRPTTGCVPMGEPVLRDVDGDGVPDVITAVHADEGHWENPTTKEKKVTAGGVWLEAVSGKTGELLWASWLEEALAPSGQRAFAAHPMTLDGKPALAVLAGRALAVFDVATGARVRGPFRLNFTPLGVPKVRGGDQPLFLVGREGSGGDELVAVSALEGKVRWVHALGFRWPKVIDDGFSIPRRSPYASPQEWPEVADLDGDGKPEVLVPLPHKTNLSWGVRYGGGVVVLDGETGQRRWEHALVLPAKGYQTGYARIKVIPDVTGDGKPDVAVARCHWVTVHPVAGEGDFIEFGVTVLSGADGKPVWTWDRHAQRKASGVGEFPDLGQLVSWALGRDGKPQLVVPVYADGARPADLLIFDSATGRLDREVKQFGEPIVSDLDGDGVPDLYAYRPGPPGTKFQSKFELAALRGTCPEVWRRLDGGLPRPAIDIDGDGVPDLFSNSERAPGVSMIVARSGATGQLLWESSEFKTGGVTEYAEADDLNGDGVRDLLVSFVRHGPTGNLVRIAALCGKTGRELWQSANLTGTLAGKTHDVNWHFQFLTPVRFRTGEVPAAVALVWVWADGRFQYFLVALSGADGRVLWQTSVGPELKMDGVSARFGAPAVVDLDGDGVRDVVFWAGPRHLVAVSGATGKVLWTREVEKGPYESARWERVVHYWDTERLDFPPPTVADLDGKGSIGVAFIHRPKDGDRLVVLNGKDGTERWTWEGPPARKVSAFNPADAMTEPQFVHLREGTFLLGVACTTAPQVPGFSPRSARHLVLIDASGKEHQRREVLGPASLNHRLGIMPMWVADLDGDGFDEIVFRPDDANLLIATRGGLRTDLWVRDYAAGESISFVRPARAGKPGTVVFRSETTVRGVDGKSGRPVWACSGTSPGPMLWPADPAAPPLVLFLTRDHGTVLRRVLPVTVDGTFQVPGVNGPR
jgi:outer membrane protein assembly factor BamB